VDIWSILVPLALLLVAAATLGRLVGKWRRSAPSDAAPNGRADPLTGLRNRRDMDEAIVRQLALMNRYQSTFSLALFDMDHFQRANDEQGHLYGDQMLRPLAQLLARLLRETDIVARYGGEELAVIMPETDLEGACVLAERLRAEVAEELSITVSGGVSAAMDGDALDSLMARADSALYAAKAAGRNQVFCHNGHQVEAVLEPAILASDERAG